MFQKCFKFLILNEIGVLAKTEAGFTILKNVFGPKSNDVCELNSCDKLNAANTTLPVSSTIREEALAAVTAHSDKAMKLAIDDLIKWQNGFVSEKIEIRKGKFGWGVHAREDLDEGFEIVNIAREDEITVERAVESIGKLETGFETIKLLFNRFSHVTLFQIMV